MEYVRKKGRGLSYLSSVSENFKSFKHFLFCPLFVHNMEIQDVSGNRVSFKMEERICNRVFQGYR